MKLYSNVTIIFCIWALSILIIFFLGFSSFSHSGKFSNNFWDNFKNWDGGHYIGIAQNGYSQKFQYAFFPIYPLSINLLNKITQNYLLAAVLISAVSTFLGIHILYKLASYYFDKKISEKVIVALLFFPTSLYFLTAYSEGLFFFFIISAFYFLEKKKLFLATVFTALASGTRLAGLALVLGLLIEILLTQGLNKKNWYIFLSPLGFIIYCIYLYQYTKDPFYFITAEEHWFRTISVPGVGFWEAIKSIATPEFINKNFSVLIDLIFAIFGLGMIIRSFRFLPISYGIYGLISMALPLFTSSLSSIPRFLLPIFPIFILIGLSKNRFIFLGYQVIALMLLSIFAVLFINGYWVS